MKSRLMLLPLFIELLWCPAFTQAEEARVLWQIGTADHAFAELAIPAQYSQYLQAFPNDVHFEVGHNLAARDWPYCQPGPCDAWAGAKEHPYAITFTLDAAPQGFYILRLNLLGVHCLYPPLMRIGVNGAEGAKLRLPPGTNLSVIRDPAGCRVQAVDFLLDRGLLRQGRNTLTLTLTDGSFVVYDSVMLLQREHIAPVENLSFQSTIFFKKHGLGLRQVLALNVDFYGRAVRTLHAHIQGEKGFTAEQEFWDVPVGPHQILQFEIPPVKEAQQATLSVSVADQVFSAQGRIEPQRHWKIYIMPHSHYDLGYTHQQEECLAIHRENTQKAITWMAKYPDFYWNMEAQLAEDYLQRGAQPREFIAWARKGRFGVGGFYANMLTGLCSGEELNHTLDAYDVLRRRYGIESRTAVMSDVPSMVGTVPMFLRGHGIKYLSLRYNPYRGPQKIDMLETPFYWESPDGSRVLMWKTDQNMLGMNNTPAQHEFSMKTVGEYLERYLKRPDYPFDAVMLHGYFTDNSSAHESVASLVRDWSSQFAYPALIETGGAEYFEYIEKHFAKHLKTVRGDAGVFWEDGAGSSAFESAETRVAKERLLSAEKIAAFGGALPAPAFRDKIAAAWRNEVLYDEHTWGHSGSGPLPFHPHVLRQWAVKKGFADSAAKQADQLLSETLKRFASKAAASEDSILIFNPSSWARSERVDVTGPDGRALSLYAEAVPALGYKLYPLGKGIPASEEPATGPAPIIENQYYAIQFDSATGAIKSLRDRQLGRELVDASQYGLNEYLLASQPSVASAGEPSALTVNRCSSPQFERMSRPGRQVMRITSQGPLTRNFVSRVVLYDEQKRIDFINELDKEANLAKEGGYFAFPLAFKDPAIRLEIPGGVIRPDLDQIPGACKDWFTVQHFLTVADASCAVAWSPIDSPLVTLQDINRNRWSMDLPIKNGNVFAYVFNNYWDTNYKACQGGPQTFRFALTSAPALDDLRAGQFGETVQSPLVGTVVKAATVAGCIEPGSLVELTGEGVVIQALKPARFEPGTVLCLREMAGKHTSVQLKLHGIRCKGAWLANLAEDRLSRLKVSHDVVTVPCRALALTTLILEQ